MRGADRFRVIWRDAESGAAPMHAVIGRIRDPRVKALRPVRFGFDVVLFRAYHPSLMGVIQPSKRDGDHSDIAWPGRDRIDRRRTPPPAKRCNRQGPSNRVSHVRTLQTFQRLEVSTSLAQAC